MPRRKVKIKFLGAGMLIFCFGSSTGTVQMTSGLELLLFSAFECFYISSPSKSALTKVDYSLLSSVVTDPSA